MKLNEWKASISHFITIAKMSWSTASNKKGIYSFYSFILIRDFLIIKIRSTSKYSNI